MSQNCAFRDLKRETLSMHYLIVELLTSFYLSTCYQEAYVQFRLEIWEKAARDPKMTTHLNQGVKAKMCETTPFVNIVGTQFIAARANIELACDSIRAQGQSLNACLGIADGKIHPVSETDSSIAASLMNAVPERWSTIVMCTTPFPADLFQEVHPHHQVLLSSKPYTMI